MPSLQERVLHKITYSAVKERSGDMFKGEKYPYILSKVIMIMVVILVVIGLFHFLEAVGKLLL